MKRNALDVDISKTAPGEKFGRIVSVTYDGYPVIIKVQIDGTDKVVRRIYAEHQSHRLEADCRRLMEGGNMLEILKWLDDNRPRVQFTIDASGMIDIFICLLEEENNEAETQSPALQVVKTEEIEVPDLVSYAENKVVRKPNRLVKRPKGKCVIGIAYKEQFHQHCDENGNPTGLWALSEMGGVFPWEFDLTIEEAWFKYCWRLRYLNERGWEG